MKYVWFDQEILPNISRLRFRACTSKNLSLKFSYYVKPTAGRYENEETMKNFQTPQYVRTPSDVNTSFENGDFTLKFVLTCYINILQTVPV